MLAASFLCFVLFVGWFCLACTTAMNFFGSTDTTDDITCLPVALQDAYTVIRLLLLKNDCHWPVSWENTGNRSFSFIGGHKRNISKSLPSLRLWILRSEAFKVDLGADTSILSNIPGKFEGSGNRSKPATIHHPIHLSSTQSHHTVLASNEMCQYHPQTRL